MKLIGTTTNGGSLVELTNREFKTLVMLKNVMEGHSIEYSHPRDSERLEADFTPSFEAILQWIQVKDRVNDLRRLATALDDAIKAPADMERT